MTTHQVITLVSVIAPPALAVLGKFLLANREPTRIKRMKRHVELYNDLPEPAQQRLGVLLEAEADAYVKQTVSRLNRQLDAGAVAALIAVGAATAFVIWLGFLLAPHTGAWIHFLTGTAALFGMLLMIAGVGQLWKDPGSSPPPDNTTAEDAAVT
jgi:hypothetical protein